MSDIASLYIKVDSSGVVTASRDLKDFEGTAQKVEGTTRKVETATDKLKTAVAGLATTYAAVKMAQFVQDMITAQMAMERMTVALKAATGSATAAASEMAYIRAESQRLGLSLQDQAKAYTKLAAASKGTSLEGKATREIFTAVSEAATALQLSADESAGALYAIGQMMSKGTVQAEELRGQLGERLPGAFQVAAKAMGVSTAELGKMLEQGKVMSDDFLPKFAKALHEHYASAIDDASKSSSANLNRMKTAIFELKVSIGEAFGSSTLGSMQAVTSALEKMKKEIERPEARQAIADLSAEFEKLIINAGQNAPNAIRKTLEALNGIMAFYNALPPEIVEAAGMGIIGRMLFGAGPGKIIAGITLINSALSRFDMNLGAMVNKYKDGAGAFQNVIDVIMGKKNWKTGASNARVNPFNENVMTGKGSNIPGIDVEAMINPLSLYQTSTSKFSGLQQGKGTSGTIQKTIDDLKKLREEWEKMSAKLNAKIEGGGLSDLAKDLIANQLEADELIKKFGKLKGAIDLIRQAQEVSDNEAIAKAEEKALDAAEKRINEQMQIDKKAYDEAEKMKNDRIKFYDDIAGYEDEAYQLKLARIEEERAAYIAMYGDIAAANAKANQDQISALETKIDGEQKWKKSAISNANSILDNLMKCYAEDSSEYKRLQNIKKVAVAAELALEVSKNAQIVAGYFAQASAAVAAANVQNAANESTAITGAVSSVAAQGSVPVAGFGLVAAMTAVMAGILGIAGIAFGGGSTSTASSGPSYTGKSTVLGAADDVLSESISKSYEILQDTYDMEYSELSQLNQSMTELNGNITGLVSSIVRTGSFNSNGFNISTGSSKGDVEKLFFKTHEIFNDVLSIGPQILDELFHSGGAKILTGINNLIAEGVGFVINGLFGGKTSTEIQETGIAAGISGKISDILENAYNINPYEYAITKTSKDGGWFGSDSESYSAYTQAASEQVTSLFRKVFINMSSSLVELAKTFGTDVNDVMNYAFESFQINLRGMSGEEINEALSAKFSEMMDIATEELFGNVLYQYQKVGEGLYETAVRLATDKAVVLESLEQTGNAFTGTATEAIALSESLINLAGDLETLQNITAKYYDKFYTDAEKQVDLQRNLSEAMNSYNLSLPGTRDGYRNLVEGMATVNQRAFIALLSMAEDADSYYSYIEDAAKEKLSSAEDALKSAFEAEKTRLTNAYETELDALNTSLYSAKESLSGITEVVNKLKSAKESMGLTDPESLLGMYQFSQKFLQTVLNQARGGDLSGTKAEGFDKVLSTLTADNSKYYKTLEEYKEAYYKTYNSIDELQGIAGDQEDAVQQTVDRLDSQIEIMKTNHEAQLAALDAQLNAILEVNTSVLSILSISQATANYKAAQTEYNTATQSNEAYMASLINSAYEKYFGREAESAGMAYWKSTGLTGSALSLAILAGAQGSDITAAHARGYADGGDFAGGLRIVGENGPELEYTGPSKIYSNSDSKKILDSDGIIKAINKLGDRLDKIEAASVQTTANTLKMRKVLTGASDGCVNEDSLPAIRMVS